MAGGQGVAGSNPAVPTIFRTRVRSVQQESTAAAPKLGRSLPGTAGERSCVADLARGWFADAISHAVDPDDPDVTLCGLRGPFTRNDDDDPWVRAPAPQCQRCAQEVPRRAGAGRLTVLIWFVVAEPVA